MELNGQVFNPSGNPVLTSLYPTVWYLIFAGISLGVG
ncbi:hypothetical protein [Pectobacterium versatile]|nr:hypothetical protein [Pectobacterium versatile]